MDAKDPSDGARYVLEPWTLITDETESIIKQIHQITHVT
jgi:hypothetical protein